MNILIIQPFLSYGGAEAISIQTAVSWAKRGHQAKVIALFTRSDQLPEGADQVTIVTASPVVARWLSRSRLLFLSLGFPYLTWLTWRHSSSVNFINPHNFPSLWTAGLVGLIKNIPVVWTCHNFPQTPFTNNFPGLFFNPLIELINRFWATRCHQITAVSRKVQSQITTKYSASSQVIYPAINFSFYSQGRGARLRRQYDLTHKFLILQVARLSQAKNQQLAIRSFAAVSKKIPHSVLVLVGDGPHQSALIHLTQQLNISRQVIFPGYQTPAQIRDWYAACDLHLMPAYQTEGCNLTPLEALCSRQVSLVAKGSGVDEILQKEEIGLIAKPTVREFSQQIQWAYRHQKSVKQMGQRGRKWAGDHLSWDKYVKNFIQISHLSSR